MIAAVGTAVYQARSPSSGKQARTESHGRAAPERALPRTADSGSMPRQSASQTPHARSAPEGRGTQSRRAAVRDLLARRAKAVRAGNRRAFLDTVVTGNPRFRARQRQLFDNLTRLPLSAWSYEISPEPAKSPPRQERTSANVWTPRLVLKYRFAGFDRKAVTATRYLTMAYGPRGWRVADLAKGSARRIWDLGKVTVLRQGPALVVGVGAPRRQLRQVARHVDRAVPVVSRIWGRDWSQRAVVLVPGTQQQADALSPDRQSLDQITAVATVASGPGGVPPPGSGDRVIINPPNFVELSSLGRGVVLRHELTHVATRAATDEAVPMWLVEGFADYIGYQGVDLAPSEIAREMDASLRNGNMPRQLPLRKDFAGSAKHLTRAYEAAWLACELIAKRYGEGDLVRLYRRLGSAPDARPQRARRKGMRSVLGTTSGKFVATWRTYVRSTLG